MQKKETVVMLVKDVRQTLFDERHSGQQRPQYSEVLWFLRGERLDSTQELTPKTQGTSQCMGSC